MSYSVVRANIDEIARKCRRSPEEIKLVTVSKNQPISAIQKAYQEGCRDFGESRIQEGLEKIAQLPDDIRWHFIGTLQRNKVKLAVTHFHVIHSVDSIELLQKISLSCEKLGKTMNLLLQVNSSGETSKHGLTLDQWKSVIDEAANIPFICIMGLMTMAPLTEDENVIRGCFRTLRLLRDEFLASCSNLSRCKELSMGMSHDYSIAIEEGATLLRIGSAIFE